MLSEEYVKIPVSANDRQLSACLRHTDSSVKKPLIINATGLNSDMWNWTQRRLSWWYVRCGYPTLSFNWKGHGKNNGFKSDGNAEDVTLSDALDDIKAVWDYAQNNILSNTEQKNIFINANSFGALVCLMALEKKLIKPEKMVLVAPYSIDTYKPYAKKLNDIMPHLPNWIVKKLPFTQALLSDFVDNHMEALKSGKFLGSTAIRFFVGDKDSLSPCKDVVALCNQIDTGKKGQVAYQIFPDVAHRMPEKVQQKINEEALLFFEQQRFRG